jgi:hypothetical protein
MESSLLLIWGAIILSFATCVTSEVMDTLVWPACWFSPLGHPFGYKWGPRQIFRLGYGHGHPCSSGPSAYPVWALLVVLVGVELGVVLKGHLFHHNLPHIPIHISFISLLVDAMP